MGVGLDLSVSMRTDMGSGMASHSYQASVIGAQHGHGHQARLAR